MPDSTGILPHPYKVHMQMFIVEVHLLPAKTGRGVVSKLVQSKHTEHGDSLLHALLLSFLPSVPLSLPSFFLSFFLSMGSSAATQGCCLYSHSTNHPRVAVQKIQCQLSTTAF